MPAAKGIFTAGATSHVQLKPNNIPIKHAFLTDSPPTVRLIYNFSTRGPWPGQLRQFSIKGKGGKFAAFSIDFFPKQFHFCLPPEGQKEVNFLGVFWGFETTKKRNLEGDLIETSKFNIA